MKQWIIFLGALFLLVSCQKGDDFDMNATEGVFVDQRDFNNYNWIRIGEQIWMAENLRYLPEVCIPSDGSFVNPKYYVYGYYGTDLIKAKEENKYSSYGVLYNWHAALSSCPVGWHLPKDYEWERLAQYITNSNELNGKIVREDWDFWADVATYLKSKNGWDYNKNGNDFYKFSGVAGGFKHHAGDFASFGIYGFYWSSSEFSSSNACFWRLGSRENSLDHVNNGMDGGLSVRCVKN